MKKILLIAPYRFLPANSGGHRYIEGWIQALSKVAKVTVIGTEDNQFNADTPYRLLPALSTSVFRYADYTLKATIKELINRNQYDLLIWEHPYYAWLAHLIKKETAVPYLLHTHNIEHLRFRSLGKWWWPLLEVYEKWAFQQAEKISFITLEDQQFATSTWGINQSNCLQIPYGIQQNECPTDRSQAKKIICERHQIDPNTPLLLFNGPLSYLPNREALEIIIRKIEPYLTSQLSNYRIIICGGEIPKRWKYKDKLNNSPFINAGFVPDLDNYIKAAQALINPIQKGGGVKTKVIEAIALGTPVITTTNGAIGIDSTCTGELLQIINSGDWVAFSTKIVDCCIKHDQPTQTPISFYKKYNWDQIIERIHNLLPY